MAPQDDYHNSEARQQTASVIWAHLSCKNLEGLIKTLTLALTTDAINVSLTCAECFPLIGAFGRHVIGQRDGEAAASSRLGFSDVCCPWVRVEHVWTDDKRHCVCWSDELLRQQHLPPPLPPPTESLESHAICWQSMRRLKAIVSAVVSTGNTFKLVFSC